jgi:homoserine acetyltransferase
MVNPTPALEFAPLVGAKTLTIDSECGHMGFLCDAATVNPAVRGFLDGK